MSKSKLKYNEAKYFYEQMKSKFKEGKTEEFKYCINAFLSSARSVFFVMQKEFRKYKGFDEWYELQKEKKFNDEKLIKFRWKIKSDTTRTDHKITIKRYLLKGGSS